MNNLTQSEKINLLETYNQNWLRNQLGMSRHDFRISWINNSFSEQQVKLLRTFI